MKRNLVNVYEYRLINGPLFGKKEVKVNRKDLLKLSGCLLVVLFNSNVIAADYNTARDLGVKKGGDAASATS